jgi:hypothetical protein
MNGEMVPIVLFIMLGVVIIAYYYWNHRNRVSIMDTVQKAIERGENLTPELLDRLGAVVNPRMRDLRRGVVFLALGIATFLCSLFFDIEQVVNGLRAAAVFPLMLGLGFLLVWKMNSD